MDMERYSEGELLQVRGLNVDKAIPQIMEAHHAELYRFVFTQVRSQQDAEDIMQDSWIRVYQALKRYAQEPPSEEGGRTLQLRAWLFTIVRNQMRTHLGKKNSFSSIPIEELNDDARRDLMFQPEIIVELRGRIEEVKAAIDQLPPTCRTVLTKVLFQELSYADIAEELGQPVGNVRTYASRGMKLLREKLLTSIGERR